MTIFFWEKSMKVKEIFLKAAPFIGIFIVASIITSLIINRGSGVERYDNGNATIPVLYMEKNDERINVVRGYKGDMDETHLRNWVYPMNSDKVVNLSFENYGNAIKSVKYTASRFDGREEIASGDVTNLQTDGKITKGTIDLSTKIKDNDEYFLKLKVVTNKGESSFATRVMFPEEREYIEALSFAKEFHGNTFNKNANTAISTYLENRTDINNNDLSFVNIGSSYDNITWSGMNITYHTNPTFNYSEINSSFTGIVATYILKSTDENGDSFYNIKEYYRIRKTDGKMYLLDFRRDMEEILDASKMVKKDDAILLGINPSDNDIKVSDSGSCIGFTNAGEVYTYNSHSDKITKIYGYIDKDITDLRQNNDEHKVRIIKAEEAGNVDFAVIGYVNKGEHEGETGIAVFSYNAQNGQTTEELFIKLNQPYQVIKELLGSNLYINDHNQLYITYDKVMYKIELKTKKVTTLAEDLSEDVYTVSEDGHLVAISNSKSSHDITEIKVMNLDTESEYTIKAPSGTKISPAGFLGTDFVYGTASDSNISTDSLGNTVFLMNKITIVNDKETVKDYNQGEYFVSKAYIEDNRVVLNRVNASDKSPAIDDSIVNLKENNKHKNTITTVNTGAKKQQKAYTFVDSKKIPEKIGEGKASVAKNSDNKMTNCFKATTQNGYFAYSAGEICAVSDDTAQAIAKGDYQSGVVLDSKGKYLWIKGKKNRQRELQGYDSSGLSGTSYSVALQMMLGRLGIKADVSSLLDEGKTPLEILKSNINGTVINLSGCGLDCALNFISEGAPVLAVNPQDQAMLIVAYDIYNITVVSPAEGKTYKIALDDSRKLFEGAGNLFLTYKK